MSGLLMLPRLRFGTVRPGVLAALRAPGALMLRARAAGILRDIRLAALRAREGPAENGRWGRRGHGEGASGGKRIEAPRWVQEHERGALASGVECCGAIVAGRFETSDVELRERVLRGTAATVGGFGGWHSLATGICWGVAGTVCRERTRVRATIVKDPNAAAKSAFGAFFVCAAGTFLVVSEREHCLARGERLVDRAESQSSGSGEGSSAGDVDAEGTLAASINAFQAICALSIVSHVLHGHAVVVGLGAVGVGIAGLAGKAIGAEVAAEPGEGVAGAFAAGVGVVGGALDTFAGVADSPALDVRAVVVVEAGGALAVFAEGSGGVGAGVVGEAGDAGV